jgi:hypothetical protein
LVAFGSFELRTQGREADIRKVVVVVIYPVSDIEINPIPVCSGVCSTTESFDSILLTV